MEHAREAGGDVETLDARSIDQIAFSAARLLPPVRPSKIVCVGRNYREHAAELGHEVPQEPLLFFKPPSALLSPGGTVLRPKISQRVDYEANLALSWARLATSPRRRKTFGLTYLAIPA